MYEKVLLYGRCERMEYSLPFNNMGLNCAGSTYMQIFFSKHTVSSLIHGFCICRFNQPRIPNLIHDLRLVESPDVELCTRRASYGTYASADFDICSRSLDQAPLIPQDDCIQ